ncbi:MAG: homocysteine S-methyltransferase family protein [Eubacteriales bacterium]|nr:homocysteine S-methyltransferase family protein [Eubacteriales bacterium]
MNDFLSRLGKELLFFDGAMGTILQEKGLKAGELPELWNITHSEDIFDVHKSYVDAGADVLTTNTFGANPIKLNGDIKLLEDIITNAVSIAKRASPNGFVALDIGPLGKLLAPYGDLPFDDAYNAFAEVVKIGKDAGADLIVIETMSDVYEAKAAVLAAKENSELPIVLTFAFNESGRLLTGADIETVAHMFNGLGIDALGFNCGLGPREILPFVNELTSLTGLPVAVNPNAGLPVSVNGKTLFNVDADEFAKLQEKVYESGAAILGGCCGTTPKHIAKTAALLKDRKPVLHTPEKVTAVTSSSRTVKLGNKPVIIGERINPTGKKLLKEALRNNDIDYLLREAVSQTEKGADILDVNVGLPEINEPEMMKSAIIAIQGISNLPLQIDTSDTNAMEKALRYYNGKALVNSVNGKEESMNTVLPLVKKYGAAVVCLTLDENGIPDTAEGRIEIAKKIVRRAEEYSISRENLVIDALAMTISTGADNAKITLDTIDYVRNKMGLNTVLGVSNISFGLPARENINSIFFANALERGLSAGIINPLSDSMMTAYKVFCALHGYDKDCADYIAAFSDITSVPASTNTTLTLREAVVKGLLEDSYNAAKALLTENAPLDIINNELIPALDTVGSGFEQNKIFLPQLLISADAAKRGFDAIKEYMIETNTASESRGDIVLATVKGDIHDIGKNIVKVLLENYGYNVIDLGKDVPPETIVDTVVKNNIKLVGLSALMTTTVCNMEETIKLLREKADCKVMVGGAVLTEDYAKSIGADYYAKDALGAVRTANKLFGYEN